MIKKFVDIKNLGVFKDFEWDKHVLDSQGKPLVLQDINILFGRNYSGKTTLSRIIRAFETGSGLEKYEGGTFNFEMVDNSTINERNFESIPYPIRVFNEDFVRENLLFTDDPEQGVTPFAVLGGNVEIEKEIQEVKGKLGSSEERSETGLYLERKNAVKDYQDAEKEIKEEKEQLEKMLKLKALDKESCIKYLSHIFGDQNYNVAKLEDELKKVTYHNQLANEQFYLQSTISY